MIAAHDGSETIHYYAYILNVTSSYANFFMCSLKLKY